MNDVGLQVMGSCAYLRCVSDFAARVAGSLSHGIQENDEDVLLAGCSRVAGGDVQLAENLADMGAADDQGQERPRDKDRLCVKDLAAWPLKH